ncbi:hypothetical protein RYX45_01320 [Alkalihalophilus pseudofirmus]|uniref:Uncharacterized protein n=1 Tax=Alkalihalophilus pseudofirmus TaxID=79885 RepID=A0AAJ2KSP4_ALKPS|nr:hypothetical protein [Alkalihalophilus pseudofirmus]MDV2883802.1 hypothetical protein [Alkalihalophilus pseudofirmus]
MANFFTNQVVKCTCGWKGERNQLLSHSKYEGYDELGEPKNWIEDIDVCPSCFNEDVDVA